MTNKKKGSKITTISTKLMKWKKVFYNTYYKHIDIKL